ncbi:hypothetical protein BH09SUM1_BH09SUM1_31490 [soil metagenome]
MESKGSVLQLVLSEIRDNPIIRYNGPFRGSSVRRILCALLLLAPPAFIAYAYHIPPAVIQMYGILPYSLRVYANLPNGLQLIVPLIFGAAFFLIFVRDYRDIEHAEQLRLTLLSRRQIAFGCMFWGVVLALYPILLSIADGILRISAEAKPAVRSMAWMPVPLSNSEELATLLFGAAVMLSSVTQGWIHRRGNNIELFLRVLLRTGFALILQVSVIDIGLEELDVRWKYDPGVVELVFGIFGSTAAILVACHAAKVWAVAAFFSESDPEDLIYREWSARSRHSMKYARPAIVAGQKRFLRAWLRDVPATLTYAFLGCAVIVVSMGLILGSGSSAHFVIVICALAGVWCVSARAYVGQRRFVVISGALRLPMFCYLVVLLIPFVVLTIILEKLGGFRELLGGYKLSGVMTIVFTLTFLLAMSAQRGRRRVLKVTGCGIAAFIAVTLLGYVLPEDLIRPIFSFLGLIVFLLCVVLMDMLLAGFAGVLIQRIHESEVLDHPPGALSTDPLALDLPAVAQPASAPI